jgi:hypothetical protein
MSATQLRLGAAKLSDPRLASDPIILEAFTLPWEDDSPDSEGEDSDSGVVDPDIELVSEVCSAKDVRDPPQDKTARIPSPALGLINGVFSVRELLILLQLRLIRNLLRCALILPLSRWWRGLTVRLF